jgi:hypothetical protein
MKDKEYYASLKLSLERSGHLSHFLNNSRGDSQEQRELYEGLLAELTPDEAIKHYLKGSYQSPCYNVTLVKSQFTIRKFKTSDKVVGCFSSAALKMRKEEVVCDIDSLFHRGTRTYIPYVHVAETHYTHQVV